MSTQSKTICCHTARAPESFRMNFVCPRQIWKCNFFLWKRPQHLWGWCAYLLKCSSAPSHRLETLYNDLHCLAYTCSSRAA